MDASTNPELLAYKWWRPRSTRQEAADWDRNFGEYMLELPVKPHNGCTATEWQSARTHVDHYEARRNELHCAFDTCTRKLWPVRVSFLLALIGELTLLYAGLKLGASNLEALFVLVVLISVACLLGLKSVGEHRRLNDRRLELLETIVYVQAIYWFLVQAMIEGDRYVLNEILFALGHKGSPARIKKLVAKYRLRRRTGE